MSKRKTDDERLAELHRLPEGFDPSAAGETLRLALGAKSNHVVAKAAELIGASGARALAPELRQAYERLLVDPVKRDPTCAGKTAIVEALVKLDYNDFDFYAAAMQFEQPEPAWGGRQDTADHLRGTAALGIIDCGGALAVLTRLTELLVDRCKAARIGAVRAIGQVSADAAPLLRLKVLVGDEEPEVIGECCAALFNLEGPSAVEFVAMLLESDDADVCEEAALALGESRQPAALEPLRSCWLAQRGAPTRATLLTAISLLRLPEANAFLLGLIRKDSSASPEALRALAWYRDVPNVRQQIEAAVCESQSAELLRLFKSEF